MPDAVFVLVVEDEVLIQEMIRTALSEGGYTVVCAVAGQEAIGALDGASHAFSALVTDIRLADSTTGWEVAHHARKAQPEIAVIYTSGDSGADYAAEGVPNSTFIQKPFVEDQVTTALSNLLNNVPHS